MEQKILAIGLIITLLAVLLFIIGAGCQQQGTEASAKNLDSELGGLDDLGNDIDSMNIDDLDDSELSDLEGLL